MQKLAKADRLQLMRFVCTFAWADLEIQRKERQFIKRLVRQLHLLPDEVAQVEEWLKVPPPAETVDPTRIPHEHRQRFLAAVKGVIVADGCIDPQEEEAFRLLDDLLQ